MHLLDLPSDTERSLVRQAIRSGKAIPDRIANAPELQIGLQLYLQAFFDLDSERSHSSSLSPIPWTSIKQYATAIELDERQTDELFYFIKKLDKVHLERLKNKITAK